MLTKDDIKKVAVMARINVSENETDVLRENMNSILGYISSLEDISGSVSPEERDTAFVRNVMRSDDNPHDKDQWSDALLKEAPKVQDNQIKVKTIL